MRLRSVPRPSRLVLQFGIASLVPIVALGVALGMLMERQIRDRTLSDAGRSAALLAGTIRKEVAAESMRRGRLSGAEIAALRSYVGGLEGAGAARLKLWAPDGTVLFSDDAGLIGQRMESHGLDHAMQGQMELEVTEMSDEEDRRLRRYGKLLEVYVPLRYGDGRPIVGAWEIYLPYRPIEAAMREDVRVMGVVLLAGLTLLYLALIPIVVRFSRTLRRHASENEHSPCTTRSRGCPTAPCSWTASPTPSPGRAATRAPSPCCCSTWTGSRT